MAFAPVSGHGASLAFGTTSAYDSLQIDSVSLDGISTEDIETTHLGTTGYRTYISGELKEGGTMSVSGLYDPNEPMLPINATETITLTENIADSGHGTAGTVAFTGYVNNVSSTRVSDDAMRFEATIKIADDITFTDSSV